MNYLIRGTLQERINRLLEDQKYDRLLVSPQEAARQLKALREELKAEQK